jgi:hypothetical protein
VGRQAPPTRRPTRPSGFHLRLLIVFGLVGLVAIAAIVGSLTGEGQAEHIHEHLDLYIDGHQVLVPAGIGIDQPAGLLSPIHTHDATGIIHVESPVVRDFTLGQFFDVWGVRFDATCVGSTCFGNGRTLSVFLNGEPYAGDPRALVLAAHQEIVVAIGAPGQLPNPIPAAYVFPAGL